MTSVLFLLTGIAVTAIPAAFSWVARTHRTPTPLHPPPPASPTHVAPPTRLVQTLARRLRWQEPEMTGHYVTLVDGTVWPVNVGDIEWQLRYGEPTKSDLLIAASVLNIYADLTNSSKRAPEAESKLARARAAQREAP